MKTLNNRIQALPQELQDAIYESLVAIDPNQIVRIDDTLEAPWQLQINKKTRQKLAPIYFGSIFVHSFDPLNPRSTPHATHKWIRAQAQIHREMMTNIRIYEPNPPDYVTHRKYYYEFVIVTVKSFFSHWGVGENLVLEKNVRYHDPDDGEFKEVWGTLEMLDGMFRCRCKVFG